MFRYVAVGGVLMVGCGLFVPVEEQNSRQAQAYQGPGDAGLTADAGVQVDAGAGEPKTTRVTTDETWHATSVAPPSDWFEVDFVDDWPNAKVNEPTLNTTLGIQGIWDSTVPATGSTKLWFRREFTLPQEIDSSWVEFACDDDMTVYLNGHLVLQDVDHVATVLTPDVTALLTPGKNVLAASCADVVAPYHTFSTLLLVEGR